VRVDQAGAREPVLAVDDRVRLRGPDVGREACEFAVLDPDVEEVDRAPVGAHDARVLDHEVEGLGHAPGSGHSAS
jgi:hypothetical protein